MPCCWPCGLVWYARRFSAWKKLLPPLLPAVLAAACMMGYNLARFGNPLEFGRSYLPEFVRSPEGQFSLTYLLQNLTNLLRPITLDGDLQLHFAIFNGFFFLAANPLFLLCLLRGISVTVRRDARNPALPLPTRGWVLALGSGITVLLLCLHRTLGGWQFGTRYLIDLFPWVILWFLARPRWQPRTGAWTLCGTAVLFNLYGALYMLQT